MNRATHDYPEARKTRANGWRRAWVHTQARPFAYLSAIRATGHHIDGLIAEVPGADWAALDEREQAYARILDSANMEHDHPARPDVAIYSVPDHAKTRTDETFPILLSYLDVVLQGYLQEFGAGGADAFIDSTDGWEAPILNDRFKPIYPRSQILSRAELDVVDSALRALGADLIERD